MKQGTTSTNVFNTTEDLRGAKIFVTYTQRGRTVLEKTNKDIVVNENNITVPLFQSDTLRFVANMPIFIQIRCVKEDGTASASNIVETTIEKALKGGVIRYE